jgi:hypothetical protein
MKNNDQLKQFINEIGFDRTLQCLIEMADDAIHSQHKSPVWKLMLAEHLENAYDAYMSGNKDSLYENA